MEHLSHRQKLIFYYGLLAAVITGIIAAIVLILSTPQLDETFSALYFPQPEELPNKIRTGEQYSVEYTVQSHENTTQNYDITSTLTLYELYDQTEGIYNCLKPYRKTVYLDWNNNSAPKYIYTNRTQPSIPDFVSEPDYHNPLVWDEYHAATSFQRERGNGTLIIYFANETQTHYVITMNTRSGSVQFNERYLGQIKLEKDQIITRLHYHNNNLDISINSINTTIKNITATNGQFGFESRDIFAKFSLTTYKDKAIEIPDRGNIWEYNIDFSKYYNFLRRARQQEQLSFGMSRVSAVFNASPTCTNEWSCSYLFAQQKNYSSVSQANITKLLYTLPSHSIRNSFWMKTLIFNTSILPFSTYSLSTTYKNGFVNSSTSFLLGENFALLIANNTASVLINNGTLHIIHLLSERTDNQSVNILINVTENSVLVQIGKKVMAFEKPQGMTNASFSTYHHNTLQTLSRVSIKNDDVECKHIEANRLCEIIFEYPKPQTLTQNPIEGLFTQQTSKNVHLLDQVLAGNDIDSTEQTSDFERHNETFIPSQSYDYNGPLTIIQNMSNVTFSTAFLPLEGDGAVILSFHTLLDQRAITITNFPKKNQTIILYDYKGAFYNKTIHKIVEGYTPLSLHIGPEIITVTQNRSILAQLKNNNVRDGYFSLTTVNLHAEFSNTLLTFSDKYKRSLPTTNDPCQLREIYEKNLRDEHFSLLPSTNQSFHDSFRLTQQFDYGKVSVQLHGSSGTEDPLEIHAWLVRE